MRKAHVVLKPGGDFKERAECGQAQGESDTPGGWGRTGVRPRRECRVFILDQWAREPLHKGDIWAKSGKEEANRVEIREETHPESRDVKQRPRNMKQDALSRLSGPEVGPSVQQHLYTFC